MAIPLNLFKSDPERVFSAVPVDETTIVSSLSFFPSASVEPVKIDVDKARVKARFPIKFPYFLKRYRKCNNVRDEKPVAG
ncbi:hypothetical protein ACQFN5_07910 [Klebsiella sp. WOUb02]